MKVTEVNIGNHVHIYRMLMRPPTPGALPGDGLIQVDDRCGFSEKSGHHYWGTVEYIRELTKEELEHYDMEEA